MKDTSKITKICNYICVALMLLLIILQFMPFWKWGDESASIQAYTWNPNSYPGLDSYLLKQLGGSYVIDQIIALPIWSLVLGVCGIVCCLIKPGSFLVSLIPAACGVVGIWGYLSKPAFRLGSNWELHLIVCIILLIVAAVSFLMHTKELKNVIAS